MADCTGTFRDPFAGADSAKGSLRGHLAAGARVIVQSSPFKSKEKGVPLPDDAIILINGINQFQFEPGKHTLVSAASCTTTALAHMMRPLLDRDLTRHMITAGMSTVRPPTRSRCWTPCRPPAPPTCARSAALWATWCSPLPTPPPRWSR